MKKELLTYCNPLPIPCIPRGVDAELHSGGYPGMFDPDNGPMPAGDAFCPEADRDYRSIGDPTVLHYGGKWYLYPSYGMAWVSEDFVTWKFVRTSPFCAKYSPAVTPWKGKILLAGSQTPLYIADVPCGPFRMLGSFILPDGRTFVPLDPALFTDDDGSLYLYEVAVVRKDGCPGDTTQIVGYELDAGDPRKIVRGPVRLLEMDPKSCPWERFGAHGQNTRFGWVEGPHMLKHGGRYYLIYGTPNAQYPNYANCVAYADDGPLGTYRRQKRNPLTARADGLVRGPGHGCVEHGPDGSLWTFYSVGLGVAHKFERRIGMDRVETDENGELYCPAGVTDMPQYAPGEKSEAPSPGLVSLLGWSRPAVSSAASGHEGIYACDESTLTWWEPEEDDACPSLTFTLDHPEWGGFDVSACRVFWHETGLDYRKGIVPGPVRYLVEGSLEGEWFPLLDRTASEEELNIDYRTFPGRRCDGIRLTVTGRPAGITAGVTDFTVFGKLHEEDPRP